MPLLSKDGDWIGNVGGQMIEIIIPHTMDTAGPAFDPLETRAVRDAFKGEGSTAVKSANNREVIETE